MRRALITRAALVALGCVLGLRPAGADQKPILCIDPGSHVGPLRTRALEPTPDGTRLVSAGVDKVARVWDADTGELIRTLRWPIATGAGVPHSLAIAPDGRTVAVATDGPSAGGTQPIWLLDLASGRLVRRLTVPGSVVSALGWSPDGACLAAGDHDGRLRLLYPAGGEPKLLRGHRKQIAQLAFSPDGRFIATASYDGTVRVWPADGGEPRVLEHDASVSSVAWSPDSKTVVSAARDRALRIWDASSGKLVRTAPDAGDIVDLAFPRDGRTVAGGDLAGGHVWSWPALSLLTEHAEQGGICSVAYAPDGRYVATGNFGGTIHVWDPNTGRGLLKLGRNLAWLGPVGWSLDGQRIACGGSGGRTFDLTSLTPGSKPNEDEGWRRAVLATGDRKLLVNDNGRSLAIVAGDREVVSWPFNADDDADTVAAVTFTPGADVAAAGFGMRLFNAEGALLRTFSGHQEMVFAVAASPDGRYLLSGSVDQTVRVWRLRSEATEVRPLLSMFFTPDGEWVVWTEQGYYAASAGAERMIGWQIDHGLDTTPDFYPAYRFRRLLYRPDVLRRVLATGSVPAALAAADSERRTTTDPTFVIDRIEEFAPPRVDILKPQDGTTIAQPGVDLVVRAIDPNGRKVAKLTLLVNGRPPYARFQFLPQRDEPGTYSARMTLPPGENTLSVVAVNEVGVESVPVSVRVAYRPTAAVIEKPALYVLAIGISDYANSAYDLGFPAKDARDLAAVYEGQRGKLFGQVEARILTDSQATCGSVREGLAWLTEHVTQRDFVVVFMAGHGLPDSRGEYYFLPYEADTARLAETALKWDEFRSALKVLPGKVVLALDTCHAASAVGTDSKSAYTDYTNVLRDAITDEIGLITMSSCMPSEVSLELDEWGNGAFTKALVEGLGGQADFSGNGVVTLGELDGYVAERVSELTEGRQHATIHRPSTIRSVLPMAVLK